MLARPAMTGLSAMRLAMRLVSTAPTWMRLKSMRREPPFPGLPAARQHRGDGQTQHNQRQSDNRTRHAIFIHGDNRNWRRSP